MAQNAAFAPERQDLYLEVFINGENMHTIGHFIADKKNIYASAKEIRDIGLEVSALAAGNAALALTKLKDVTFRYDEARQAIYFQAKDNARVRRRLLPEHSDKSAVSSVRTEKNNISGVVNYLFYGNIGTSMNNLSGLEDMQTSASTALDARIGNGYGVFNQSGILGVAGNDPGYVLRLDTAWSYEDEKNVRTYRAGDLIGGSLPFTRALRLGGFQMQRSFDLRPDLITTPLASISGSAAVPSTVDVLVNNVRTFSQDVPAGPFEIGNLPLASGAGTQSLVIRDAQGRETVQNFAFYSSSRLLERGFLDYSVEAGAPRFSYGLLSNDYGASPVASVTARYGLRKSLTLETHAESDGELTNGSGGGVFSLGALGLGSFAGSVSSSEAGEGAQLNASLEMDLTYATVMGRAQHSFGNYTDLASISHDAAFAGKFPLILRPPRALYQAAMTIPVHLDASSFTLASTHIENMQSASFDILSLSYTRPFLESASFFVSGFKDFSSTGQAGGYAGLSFILGRDISANAASAISGGKIRGGLDLAKVQPAEAGTFGWHMRDFEGSTTERAASASYRNRVARFDAGVQQLDRSFRLNGETEGAVAFSGKDIFLANRVDDSFAVVDVGMPNVAVYSENRKVGVSDAKGQVLVPSLRAHQMNQFSIDPFGLPAEANIPATRLTVIPASKLGTSVSFATSKASRNILLTVKDTKGEYISAGSTAQLNGTGELMTVGYDGEVYLKDLQQENIVHVERPDGIGCDVHLNAAVLDKAVMRQNGICQ